ncbi:MAG TPA: tetratricopeptide repeat protein [Burkholderiales bacterium]|nr:tetratricopeptide repeat protein [Burkholderiales bacterium]
MLKNLLRVMLPWRVPEGAGTPRLQASIAAELGRALGQQALGDLHGAEQIYRSILAEQENASTLHLLGHVLTLQAKTAEAVSVLSRAAALTPDDADVSFNLACALQREGRIGAAERAFRRAVDLRPEFVAAWLSLAGVMTDADDLDAAEDCFQRALGLDPSFAEAHYNYGNLLHREGRIAEALSQYRSAMSLKPDFMRAHSNLVYALNFSGEHSPEEIFNEHREWARVHADPLTREVIPHSNPRTSERTLRVGYVSPNFRDHAVTYFFESTLRHHDPGRVAAYCYSDVERSDAYTERLRRGAHAWRDIAGQDDQSVAELVRGDAIDILVDLTGHTDNHRLLMFARRPAPVQVTWNGYANTTGMLAMDYRISDARADPPGMTEHLHTEKLVRLPEIYMAFTPPAASPEVSAAPVSAAGHITLGSFNALSKVTGRVIRVWSEILYRLPESRLLVFTVPAGRTRERIMGEFAAHGIARSRLELIPRLPLPEFLQAPARVDIALDPFPFSGTTTTCQTLWMGVPVITLAGKSHVSRVGATMLNSVGLEQCVAESEGDYVTKAIALAADPVRLQEMRHGLRKQMARSPLANGPRLTRFLEDAYAKMWEDYCHQSAGGGA